MKQKEYIFCCEMIWGGVPIKIIKGNILISKEENMETPIFKEKAPEILKKYPKLDYSI